MARTIENRWIDNLQRARAGEEEALFELWNGLRQYLHWVTLQEMDRRLERRMDASDIVQQALYAAQRGLPKFRGNTDAELKAWLQRLLKHIVVDCQRQFYHSRKRDITRELECVIDIASHPDDSPSASAIAIRSEVDGELTAALNRLPHPERQLIELRHRRGLSVSQIAMTQGVPEHQVRRELTKAMGALRRELIDFVV